MNRIISRLFGIVSLTIGGAIMFGGCGFHDLYDPYYPLENIDAGINNAEGKVATDNIKSTAAAAGSPEAPAGAPAGSQLVPAVPAVPVVELPPALIREPDLVNPQPGTVVNTGEVRPMRRAVEHYREIWQPQENVRVHNIDQPYTEHHRYRQRVINAPTTRTVITYSGRSYFTQEMLPTEMVTLPLVDFGVVFGGWRFGGWGR